MKNRLGLIINPWAGIGGSVALRGSDGENIKNEALKRGAIPKAEGLVRKTLYLLPRTTEFICGSGAMGENLLKELGFKYKVVYHASNPSTANDTINIAKLMKNNVDLLIFAGGDGTARDVYSAVQDEQLCLGIPTGVKMHSGVFALSPEIAGRLINLFFERKTLEHYSEVVDLDEDAYRRNHLLTQLFGYLKIPQRKELYQNRKFSVANEDNTIYGMARTMIELMREDVIYAIGAGSTLDPIMKLLGEKGTLLGIDLILNRKIIKKDCTESDLLDAFKKRRAEVVITPIGGQGYIFGRGNQQFSSRVLDRINTSQIHILASQKKLYGLRGRPLFVYTSNELIDRKFEGHFNVITGYNQFVSYRVSAPY